LREPRGGTRSRGGNRLALGDQEAVGGDAQRGAMMEATPASAFEVAKPEFLLELLVVTLDAPAQLGQIDQTFEGDVVWQGREPVLGRRLLAFGPFDQEPLLAAQFVAMSGAHAQAGEAGSQPVAGAFAPADRAPSPPGQAERKLLDRDRLVFIVAAYQEPGTIKLDSIIWYVRQMSKPSHVRAFALQSAEC